MIPIWQAGNAFSGYTVVHLGFALAGLGVLGIGLFVLLVQVIDRNEPVNEQDKRDVQWALGTAGAGLVMILLGAYSFLIPAIFLYWILWEAIKFLRSPVV